MDEAATRRQELPPEVVTLADELLRRLELSTPRGRIELTYKGDNDGRPIVVKLRRNEEFYRSELSQFDARAVWSDAAAPEQD